MRSLRWLVVTLILLFLSTITITLSSFIFSQAEARPSLLVFGVIHFLGYLFFFLMPVELLIPLYVSYGYAALPLFFLAVVTAFVPLIFDYAFGRLFPEKRLLELIGEKRYARYHGHLEKWGKYVVLFFAATPLSIPILVLVAGIVRFDIRKTLIYSFIGLSVKYAALTLFFTMF